MCDFYIVIVMAVCSYTTKPIARQQTENTLINMPIIKISLQIVYISIQYEVIQLYF